MMFETKKEAWARNKAESRRAQKLHEQLEVGAIYQLPSGRPARYMRVTGSHTLEFHLVCPERGADLPKGCFAVSAAYASKVKPWVGGAEV